MNNIVKSVVFAAVVLFAGIAAMQIIYKNNDAENADITAVEPAAGENAAMTDTMTNDANTVEPMNNNFQQTSGEVSAEEAADAQKDAIEEAAEAQKDAVDANVEAAQDQADQMEESAEEAKDAIEEDAEAAKDMVEERKDAMEAAE